MHLFRRLVALAAMAATITLVGGCGEVTGVSPFEWTVTPGQAEATVGGLAHFQVKITSKSNINHDVDLATGAVPDGLVVTIPRRMTSTQEIADFTISVSPEMEEGTYTVEIRAHEVSGESSLFGTEKVRVIVRGGAAVPDFSLEVTPNPSTPEEDQVTHFEFTVTALHNFAGTVTMSLTGLPDDLTYSAGLTPSSFTFVPGGSNVQGGNFALVYHRIPPVTSPLDLFLTATSGPIIHTRTLTLTLPPPAASFALSLSKNGLSIAQGDSTPTTTVNIARTNFAGDVTLSVLNLPAGVTASFAPANPISGNFSVLTLTVPLATPVGDYTLGVHGAGTAGTMTTPLTLTVAAPLTLAIFAGDMQSGIVGGSVAIPPAVIITNASGQGVEGIEVLWAVVQGNAIFSVERPVSQTPNTGTSDAGGIAKLHSFVPQSNGTIKLRAFVSEPHLARITPLSVEFTITGVAPACTTIEDHFAVDAGWTAIATTSGGTATQSVSFQNPGGNPGGYRQMQHKFTGAGAITVYHYNGTTYNPSTQGAIDHINYYEDQIELNPPFTGAAVGTGFSMMQGSTPYNIILPPSGAFTNTIWQTARLTLTAANFPPGVNFATGGPITFGYFRSNTNSGSGSYTTTHGIDNWRVEVCRAGI